MITFRISKQCFVKNTFIAAKTTPIAKTLNSFGYIKNISKKGIVTVDWYSHFVRAELRFKMSDLIKDYKSIFPYYNTAKIRGNIWKHSYRVLLDKIDVNKGFNPLKVDKLVYKKVPIIGSDVKICSAQVVLDNQLTDLRGIVRYIDRVGLYTIETAEGEFKMSRCSFELLPQDYFILLSIRCY